VLCQYAIDEQAEILAEHPEYNYVGQHQNLANPRGHYVSTGPEIWRDTCGAVDILVAPLGTGGTICGTGRYLKERKPSVQLIAVEPRCVAVDPVGQTTASD
jgi:cysteine synthase A